MRVCIGSEAEVAILVRRLAVMGVFHHVDEALGYTYNFCTAHVC